MKRIKELRRAQGITQTELAALLGTTQQTVGRWESGKAAPSVAMINALAHALSTSVSSLIGASTTAKSAAVSDEDDWFWGHIGLLLPRATKSIWFPISEATQKRVWSYLRNTAEDDRGDWLAVETMNNRFLAFCPDRLDKIYLLDDDCDGPEGDWEPDLWLGNYAGFPDRYYDIIDAIILDSDLDHFAAEDVVHIRQLLQSQSDTDDEDIYRRLHDTKLHYSDGRVISYQVEPADLANAMYDVETGGTRMIYLPGFSQSDQIFIPAQQICLMDGSLIDLRAGDKVINDG